jgi:predicted O-linked N-acetylglucosamine transferase (SPINDLY family)
MRELVMENLADYEAMALSLARDPARLKGIKEKLVQNLPNTPLFDADRFRHNIEDAFVRMLASR